MSLPIPVEKFGATAPRVKCVRTQCGASPLVKMPLRLFQAAGATRPEMQQARLPANEVVDKVWRGEVQLPYAAEGLVYASSTDPELAYRLLPEAVLWL